MKKRELGKFYQNKIWLARIVAFLNLLFYPILIPIACVRECWDLVCLDVRDVFDFIIHGVEDDES